VGDVLSGAVGVVDGATAIYAHTKHWTTEIPTTAWAGGLAAAIVLMCFSSAQPATS